VRLSTAENPNIATDQRSFVVALNRGGPTYKYTQYTEVFAMWDTYKYLNKLQKDTINRVDVKDMEEMLMRGERDQAYWNNFIWVYATLLKIFAEGHKVLNEAQIEVVCFPRDKFGADKAGMILYEMRQRQREDQAKAAKQ
jgi:hypothetical protein